MPRTRGRGTGPWSQHWSAGPWWKWCFAGTWHQARCCCSTRWRSSAPAVATHAPARRGCGLLRHVDDRRPRRILTGSHGAPLNSTSAALDPDLRPVPVGLRSGSRNRPRRHPALAAHHHRRRPHGLGGQGRGVRVLPVRRRARRRGPLSRPTSASVAHRPGQGPRTRTARARTPRHRRPPRLGHRHPGPGRTCHRSLPPGACRRGPGRHRGRSDPHPHRAARHRRRAPRLAGHGVRAAARRGRGRAARHRWPDASLRRGDALRRVRRPQPGGRSRDLPPGPGVHHQRSSARPPRDPGHRRSHRRRRPGTADHRRRRLRRRRPRPRGLRPGGHADAPHCSAAPSTQAPPPSGAGGSRPSCPATGTQR